MMRNDKRMDWIKEMNAIPPTELVLIIGENFSHEDGVTLGSEGFGAERNDNGEWVECQQHGGIKIGNNVTIKSGSKIKRATMPGDFTEIGDGTKICSLVNVGHNCKFGEHNFIGPNVSFNGGVEIGDRNWISASAVIKDRLKIGNDVIVGLGAVVLTDLPDGVTVVGNPAVLIEYAGNWVHPSFKHGKNFKIGKGCIIHEDVQVGDNVTIQSGVELRSDTIIGDDCYIDSGVKSSGRCRIGNRVTLRYDTIIARDVIIRNDVYIAPQVMFINIDFIEKDHPRRPTIIGNSVKIGTNATIDAGVRIADYVIIGAKSMVVKDCLDELEVYRASSEIVAKRR